jgi:hypothetical protein
MQGNLFHRDHEDHNEKELLLLIFEQLREIYCEIRDVFYFLRSQYNVVGFKITQQGASPMTIKGILPGGTGTFTATPLDKNGSGIALPAGMTITWASDVSGATITPDTANPLNATVAVDASVTPGTVINLTASATNTDGTPATGAAQVPVLTVTVDVASFQIDQTA